MELVLNVFAEVSSTEITKLNDIKNKDKSRNSVIEHGTIAKKMQGNR